MNKCKFPHRHALPERNIQFIMHMMSGPTAMDKFEIRLKQL